MNSSSVVDDDEPVIQPPPFARPLYNTSSPRDHEPSDANLEDLKRWQQDRVERRLKGEYESRVRKLVEVVSGNLEKPGRIISVRVQGAPRTRESFLGQLISPHMIGTSNSSRESTFSDALQTTRRLGALLNETQIFSSVQTSVERSFSPFAEPNDVDVVFRVRERGRFFLKTATDVGNQEGSASATAHVLNAFGGGETLEGNVSFGTKTRQAVQLRLDAPLVALDPTLSTKGEISAFVSERDNTSFASSVESVRGVKVAVRTMGAHEFAYELTSRQIGQLTERASLSMREAAGHSLKSAITHTYLHDTRDDPMFGTRGMYSKVSHEIAGLGGDVAHFKSESVVQASRRVTDGLSVSCSTSMGMLWPLALWGSRPKGSQSMFSDRFQVGGPLSVRSFKQNGLGPRDGSDSLGGDMYWSAGLSVFSDIPKKPHWPVKLQTFVNAGRLDAFDRSKPIDLINSVKQSLTQPSISAGVGLIYRFDPVRVEVNFGVPLVASASDLGRKGFQVGMGLEFL